MPRPGRAEAITRPPFSLPLSLHSPALIPPSQQRSRRAGAMARAEKQARARGPRLKCRRRGRRASSASLPARHRRLQLSPRGTSLEPRSFPGGCGGAGGDGGRQGVAASGGGGLHGERRAPEQRRRFHRCAPASVTRVPSRVAPAARPRRPCPRRRPSRRRPSAATLRVPTPRRGGGGRVPTVAAGAAAAGARL